MGMWSGRFREGWSKGGKRAAAMTNIGGGREETWENGEQGAYFYFSPFGDFWRQDVEGEAFADGDFNPHGSPSIPMRGFVGRHAPAE